MTEKEICGNCDREIGRLEEAFLWKDRPVCAECFGRLSGAAPGGSSENTQAGEVQTIEQTAKIWKALQMIGGMLSLISLVAGMIIWLRWGLIPAVWIAAGLLAAGMATWAYAEFSAWWHHG